MHVGGKLEPNELPEAALSREVLEETGCEMEILSYIGKYETVAANELNHSLVSYLYQVKLKVSLRFRLNLRKCNGLILIIQTCL